MTYYKTSKFEDAAKDFRMVEKLSAKPETTLLQLLGESYYNAKKYAPALEYFDKIIAAGVTDAFTRKTDSLKYQANSRLPGAPSNELMTIKLRYKRPDQDNSS